jgi:hypothetical protein
MLTEQALQAIADNNRAKLEQLLYELARNDHRYRTLALMATPSTYDVCRERIKTELQTIIEGGNHANRREQTSQR